MNTHVEQTIAQLENYGGSVLSVWRMYHTCNAYPPQDIDLRIAFIPQVLIKKLNVFEIPIHLSDPLLELMRVCSCNNPGYAQILLAEIIKRIPNKTQITEICPEDFDRVVKDWGFPIMLKPDIQERFNKLWEEQKTWQKAPTVDYTGNQIDTRQFWENLLK